MSKEVYLRIQRTSLEDKRPFYISYHVQGEMIDGIQNWEILDFQKYEDSDTNKGTYVHDVELSQEILSVVPDFSKQSNQRFLEDSDMKKGEAGTIDDGSWLFLPPITVNVSPYLGSLNSGDYKNKIKIYVVFLDGETMLSQYEDIDEDEMTFKEFLQEKSIEKYNLNEYTTYSLNVADECLKASNYKKYYFEVDYNYVNSFQDGTKSLRQLSIDKFVSINLTKLMNNNITQTGIHSYKPNNCSTSVRLATSDDVDKAGTSKGWKINDIIFDMKLCDRHLLYSDRLYVMNANNVIEKKLAKDSDDTGFKFCTSNNKQMIDIFKNTEISDYSGGDYYKEFYKTNLKNSIGMTGLVLVVDTSIINNLENCIYYETNSSYSDTPLKTYDLTYQDCRISSEKEKKLVNGYVTYLDNASVSNNSEQYGADGELLIDTSSNSVKYNNGFIAYQDNIFANKPLCLHINMLNNANYIFKANEYNLGQTVCYNYDDEFFLGGYGVMAFRNFISTNYIATKDLSTTDYKDAGITVNPDKDDKSEDSIRKASFLPENAFYGFLCRHYNIEDTESTINKGLRFCSPIVTIQSSNHDNIVDEE